MIEIDILAKACGLRAFPYCTFPPVVFDVEALRPHTVDPVSEPAILPSVAPDAAVPVRIEPRLELAPAAVPIVTAPLRGEPVASSVAQVEPARPLEEPAGCDSQPNGTAHTAASPATPQPALSMSEARQPSPDHPVYEMLQDVAHLSGEGRPCAVEPGPPRAAPALLTPKPRRQARPAGRAAMSAIRSK